MASSAFDDEKENAGRFSEPASEDNVGIKAVRSITTLVVHILIGVVTGAATLYAFRSGKPLNATSLHVFLCVVGYQFLMAEAILSLAPDSWLSTLRLKHKRLIHWVMQIGGSVLAISGSFVKIADKSTHWNTLHGQFALVALVFTTVSLVNGLASLYAYEWRRFIPGILSKLTHICFGIVAFGAASICLCYGIDKGGFRSWITTRVADSLIIMVAVLTTIVIINPFITFYQKLSGVLKR